MRRVPLCGYYTIFIWFVKAKIPDGFGIRRMHGPRKGDIPGARAGMSPFRMKSNFAPF
jgi:hypothetical protein